MSEERKCKACGATLADDQDFCPKCGSEYGYRKCLNCGAKLADDQEFCSKCGTEYGKKKCKKCGESYEGEKKLCKKCLKKKKRNKILILIPIILLIVAVIVVFARGMQMAGGNIDQLSKMISEGHYSCFISHTFEEPNCLHGYLCTECGYEEGNVADHNWVNATCTTASTCSVCGLTSGTALGHTTDFGVCSRCGQGVETLLPEYVGILENVNYAISEMKSSANYFNSGLYDMADFEFELTADYIGYAISECGSYTEFAEVKRILQNAKTGFTNAANATSVNSTISYAEDGQEALNKAGNLLVSMGEFLD